MHPATSLGRLFLLVIYDTCHHEVKSHHEVKLSSYTVAVDTLLPMGVRVVEAGRRKTWQHASVCKRAKSCQFRQFADLGTSVLGQVLTLQKTRNHLGSSPVFLLVP